MTLNFIFALLLIFPAISYAWERGIYLTQSTLENTERLNYLIKRAKAVEINTFVIDMMAVGKRYDENIKLVKANNIKYVARVVVFPDGGTDDVVRSKAYWEKRYKLVQHAIDLGASAIQLDYIRYDTKRAPLPQYTKDVHNVVKFFKERVAAQNIPLQLDVFGETCFAPSKRIGQDLTVLAQSVDAINPMVYPSHYWPHEKHTQQPYETIATSLDALSDQFDEHVPFKVHAFIEASNYHKRMSSAATQAYILKQMKAVEDSGIAHGWYVWSAHNHYDNLFELLETRAANSKNGVGKTTPDLGEGT